MGIVMVFQRADFEENCIDVSVPIPGEAKLTGIYYNTVRSNVEYISPNYNNDNDNEEEVINE